MRLAASPRALPAWSQALLAGLSSQDSRDSIVFSFVENFEVAECLPQFACTGPPTAVGEFLGSDTDLAANGNCEEAAGNEPIDHRAIESEVAEQVAEREVDRFAVGESGIQVADIEAAPAGQTRELSQLPSQLDGDRGHVHTPVRHPSTRQPHRAASTTARDLQRLASRWKEMIDVGERLKCRRLREDRRHAAFAVPAIPVLTMTFAHGSTRMLLSAA